MEVDSSDVLVLGIRTTESFGISCTEASVKILGTSRKKILLMRIGKKKGKGTERIKIGGVCVCGGGGGGGGGGGEGREEGRRRARLPSDYIFQVEKVPNMHAQILKLITNL